MTAPFPDPRCPRCGYTMCELFDYEARPPLAFSATPNGKYQCYHCTPQKSHSAPPRQREWCSCIGSCRGAEGLSPKYRCAVEE